MSREAAITGLGLLTATAVGTSELEARLRAGEPSFARTALPGQARRGWLAWLSDFVPESYVDPMVTRRMDPLSVRAIIAARFALSDAGLGPRARSDPDPSTGVAMGTAYGCQTTSLRHATRLVEQGASSANPIDFPDSIDGAPAAHVAMECGLGGPSVTSADGELAGEMALVAGMMALDAGRAERMVVVAGDELTATLAGVLERMGALCPGDLPEPPGPYDRRRCGLIPAESTAALVLEEREHAERRGARVYGFLSGPGLGSEPDTECDSYPRHAETYQRSVMQALGRVGLSPGDVDLFSGAAAGLREFDQAELLGAEQWADRARPPWLVALRGQFGYCPSDGVLRMAAACVALQGGFVPPAIGLEEPEPATRLRWSARVQAAQPNVIVHQGATRGGQCVSLVLRRP